MEKKPLINRRDIDIDILSELIKYQYNRLHSPYEVYPKQEKFIYNLHDVIEKGGVLESCENKLIFYGKNYNSNIYEWAKDVLWYGRRIGAYKTNVRK